MRRGAAVHLCGGAADWDDDRGTYRPELGEDVLSCPRESEHCYGPRSYTDWHEWAKRRRITHRQVRCECGRWLLMEPKAVRVEAQREEENDG